MRKSCPIPRKNLDATRIRAVRARKAGMRTCDIAMTLGISPITVSRWIGKYKRSGARGLLGTKPSGRPKKVDCNKFAPKLLKIVESPATKFGFTNELWNSSRLRLACKQKLGVEFSKTTLWRALRNIGLSYQIPERRAFEADPKEREAWIKKTWPKLQKKAKQERAVILFEDESTLSLIPTLGKTWSKIGHTPIVTVTGKKGNILVMSAISPSGRLFFKIPKNNVNSSEFIRFLEQILKDIKRKKIYMIADRGPAHTSKLTKAFFDQESRMELVLLPSYSPDLNPDELVWGRLKNIEMKTHNSKSKDDLRVKTFRSMKSIQGKRSLVKSFFEKQKLT